MQSAVPRGWAPPAVAVTPESQTRLAQYLRSLIKRSPGSKLEVSSDPTTDAATRDSVPFISCAKDEGPDNEDQDAECETAMFEQRQEEEESTSQGTSTISWTGAPRPSAIICAEPQPLPVFPLPTVTFVDVEDTLASRGPYLTFDFQVALISLFTYTLLSFMPATTHLLSLGWKKLEAFFWHIFRSYWSASKVNVRVEN